MRNRTLVATTMLISISIVSLVLTMTEDGTELETPLSDKTIQTSQPIGVEDDRSENPPAAAASPPNLKGMTLDPNKPRPLPAYVDTMPTAPPPMPTEVPAMPSDPPSMPHLVVPAPGEMPYDPSKYLQSSQKNTPEPQATKPNPTVPTKTIGIKP